MAPNSTTSNPSDQAHRVEILRDLVAGLELCEREHLKSSISCLKYRIRSVLYEYLAFYNPEDVDEVAGLMEIRNDIMEATGYELTEEEYERVDS